MTWTKLPDTFSEEFEELGAEAMALHVAALCYCNRLLTDGHIPARKARTLFPPIDDPDLVVKALVDAGYWLETETGYQIADFFRDQRSAETVLTEREANRKRLANWRAAKAARRRNGVSNGVTNGVSNGLPDPTRPETRGGSAAPGSPGGSPSAPAEETSSARPETTHHALSVSGVECNLQSSPLTPGVDVPPDYEPGLTCVRFSVSDGRADTDDAGSPVGRLMVELYQAVFGVACRLAWQREPPRADSQADLYGVEIVVSDGEAGAWVSAVYSAALSAEVQPLAGQLSKTLAAQR